MKYVGYLSNVALTLSMCVQVQLPAEDKLLIDTDADGHIDRGAIWIDGRLYFGEDLNGDGIIIFHCDVTSDEVFDESDPFDSSSKPPYEAWVTDSDGDGLSDAEEDFNVNGVFESAEGETNPLDADSDDDGLGDGLEIGFLWGFESRMRQFRSRTDPLDPDSDDDGLPDGLELGISEPTLSLQIVHHSPIPSGSTDRKATFEWIRTKTDGTTETVKRACFIGDTDPMSVTDPQNSDTNYDGRKDGQDDENANGKCDNDESDPAVGIVDYLPVRRNSKGEIVPGRIYGTSLRGHISPFRFAYQSSANSAFVVRAKPHEDMCFEAENVHGTRIWIITCRPLRNNKESFEVWVDSPALPGGISQKFELTILQGATD